MKPRKYRLRIRLHRKIYDLLEMEALWQDSKIGTLANRILQEELAKLRQVGLDHCVCGDEDAASARRIEAEKHPESYYMLPSFDCREKYMPTHGRGLDTKGQVTLLVTAEQLQLIDALFDRESGCVRGLYSESQGQAVKSYRRCKGLQSAARCGIISTTDREVAQDFSVLFFTVRCERLRRGWRLWPSRRMD